MKHDELKEIVFEAMDNAVSNGYYESPLEKSDYDDITCDLLDYDAELNAEIEFLSDDLELYDAFYEDVVQLVDEWEKKRRMS